MPALAEFSLKFVCIGRKTLQSMCHDFFGRGFCSGIDFSREKYFRKSVLCLGRALSPSLGMNEKALSHTPPVQLSTGAKLAPRSALCCISPGGVVTASV